MAFILLNVFLSFMIVKLAYAQMEYQNAEGERGTCVNINNCPTVYSLFNSEPLSLLTIEFLRRSKCEYDDRKQLLCCVDPESNVFMGEGQPSAGFNLKIHPKASLLPLDSCGLDRKRIWQGSNAKLGEFPWTALVHYYAPYNATAFVCGGTLINKRYVLTVGHCAQLLESKSNPLVRLGEYDLGSDLDCETDVYSGRQQCAPPPQDIGIEQVILHPEFHVLRATAVHDIALLRLEREAKLDSEFVKPICLPTTGDLETGKGLLVAGWEHLNTWDMGSVKVKVEVPLVSSEECNKLSSQVNISIGEGQLCAGGVAGQDSCQGDSGMPLMDWTELLDNRRRYSVVGLVSHSLKKCGLVGWPGVYTKVFHYVPWILENIEP